MSEPPFNWTCPFCAQQTTITSENYSLRSTPELTRRSKRGVVVLVAEAIACPNPKCLELFVSASLNRYGLPKGHSNGSYQVREEQANWRLLPRSRAKPQPEYIPATIRKDYEEACLILSDSPNASATLSRRCLQGMVRDYWKLTKGEMGLLAKELDAIESKVDPSTWDMIQTIREVGNIGAHMEKDVNYVVEVEADEAALLIELVEALFADWYVARAERLERDKRAKALAQKKRDERQKAREKAKAAEKVQGATGDDSAPPSLDVPAEATPTQAEAPKAE